MWKNRRPLTLDSNVFIAALKKDEKYSERCYEIIRKVPDRFLLMEPSIIYQEVCGTLARRVGTNVADMANKILDSLIHPMLLFTCNKAFCTTAYSLCSEFNIYAIDALYLKVALENNAILVSLDKEEFIDKINSKKSEIEAYHVSNFPY
ncbi:MAG: PIN domain-containing protein [Nitrososphaeria archaeon]|nr:PIN domain-containing protein [Nitrososphaeria archaeon]